LTHVSPESVTCGVTVANFGVPGFSWNDCTWYQNIALYATVLPCVSLHPSLLPPLNCASWHLRPSPPPPSPSPPFSSTYPQPFTLRGLCSSSSSPPAPALSPHTVPSQDHGHGRRHHYQRLHYRAIPQTPAPPQWQHWRDDSRHIPPTRGMVAPTPGT